MAASFYLMSSSASSLMNTLAEDIDIQHIPLDRSSKELIKRIRCGVLILELSSGDDHRTLNKLLNHIPINAVCYTVLVNSSGQLVERFGPLAINERFSNAELVFTERQRLIQLSQLLEQTDKQQQSLQAQTQLLLSINHFAHFNTPWQTLISEFANRLAEFCGATVTLSFDNKKQSLSLLAADQASTSGLSSASMTLLSQEIKPATELGQPNINLSFSDELAQGLKRDTGVAIEAVLTFPLVVYEQVFHTVVCLIDEQQMSSITVQQVDIMKEAAIQLRILIERRVAENKLKAQFQRLRNALQELHSTKEQLVHSEKMAAVGKLAAGIAHEINNPLSYVLGNLEPLDDYLATIVKLLSMHDELLSNLGETINEPSKAIKSQIVQEQEEEDLDFVLDDIKAIVDNSKDGLLRVRDIINDLSSFSRQQPLQAKTFEINNLLQDTLRLLKYEISDQIKVSITGEDPIVIDGQPGFTQQILTNLVKNAIHAIRDAGQSKGEIELQYEASEEGIVIRVKDNGPGIPEEHRQSVFTPFFTTKEIGKGTGLGLSVSYNLAKKMGGNLALLSQDVGTVFQLILPKNHTEIS